jgi:hypothetical protein
MLAPSATIWKSGQRHHVGSQPLTHPKTTGQLGMSRGPPDGNISGSHLMSEQYSGR